MKPTVATLPLGFLLLAAGCSSFPTSLRFDWHRSDTAEPAILALEVCPSNHIFVRGEIGDTTVPILLDSGASITVLDREFARSLGLRRIGRMEVAGVGGQEEANVVQLNSIRIGDVTLGAITAITLDLTEIEQRIGHRIPIILGRGLFEGAVVEIDYPGRRFTLHSPESFRYAGGGRTVPLQNNDAGLKNVRCQIEDLAPAWFQLDTGSGQTLSVFEDYAAEQGILHDARPRSQRLGGGIGGFALDAVSVLDGFQFAGYDLRAVPGHFPTPVEGAFVNQRYAGNLGGGLLRRFRLWIDFGRNRMHVEPGPGWDAPFGMGL